MTAQVVKGIVAGCQESDCILMGGEVRAPKQRILTSNTLRFDVLEKNSCLTTPARLAKRFQLRMALQAKPATPSLRAGLRCCCGWLKRGHA